MRRATSTKNVARADAKAIADRAILNRTLPEGTRYIAHADGTLSITLSHLSRVQASQVLTLLGTFFTTATVLAHSSKDHDDTDTSDPQ